jgi:hypothetical protein
MHHHNQVHHTLLGLARCTGGAEHWPAVLHKFMAAMLPTKHAITFAQSGAAGAPVMRLSNTTRQRC